jgi:hypothetical protein
MIDMIKRITPVASERHQPGHQRLEPMDEILSILLILLILSKKVEARRLQNRLFRSLNLVLFSELRRATTDR